MENKPPLPRDLNYKTAITHYLKEMGNLIKETLKTRWPDLVFFQQVLIIMTVNLSIESLILYVKKNPYNPIMYLNRFQMNMVMKPRMLCANVHSKRRL